MALSDFGQAELDLGLNNPTSVEFGPDGRMYVSEQGGLIKVFSLTKDNGAWDATLDETIDLIKNIPNHNDDGSLAPNVENRQITGITLDSDANGEPVVYVTSSDPRISVSNDSGLDTNSGILSKLTPDGNGGWNKLDLVRGLPRSEENHSTNGLDVGTDDNGNKVLYVAQGGHTNKGAPGNNFSYTPEYYYSGAILKVDLDKLDGMSVQTDPESGQDYLFDLPTLNDPTRDDANETVFGGNDGLNQAKFDSSGTVTVHQPGHRNPYDVVTMANGKVYTWDNGPNGGWGGIPENPNGQDIVDSDGDGLPDNGPASNNPNESNSSGRGDQLHLVQEGVYAGHPNPIRAAGSDAGLYGDGSESPGLLDKDGDGNPDIPSDFDSVNGGNDNPEEGVYIGNGDGALDVNGASTNGLAEFTASSDMQGDLLAVDFGGNLIRVSFNQDGTAVTEKEVVDLGGQTLDVAAQGDDGAFPGAVFVARRANGDIKILDPEGTGIGQQPGDDRDDDGIPDVSDAFAADPHNGTETQLQGGETLSWTFDLGANQPPPPGPVGDFYSGAGFDGFGVGVSGIMTDGSSSPEDLQEGSAIGGGAAGLFTVKNVTGGDAFSGENSQDNAYQFGLNVGADVQSFTISAKMDNPFDEIDSPEPFQSQGIFIGTGDQDNYLKWVAGANNGGIFEVGLEDGGNFNGTTFAATELLDQVGTSDTITLNMEVDPATGTLTPTYSFTVNDGAQTITGPDNPQSFQLSGPALDALQGTYQIGGVDSALALGMIATANPQDGTAENFVADWDRIDVSATGFPDNEIVIDDPAELDSGDATPGTDTVVYGGSGDITLPQGIENLELTGSGGGVTGNDADNDITSGTGDNAISLGGGDNTVRGSQAELDGDSITGFGEGDRIVVEGTALSEGDVDFASGSVGITTPNAQFTITDDLDPDDFQVTAGNGDTVITFVDQPDIGAVVAAVNAGGDAFTSSETGVDYQADDYFDTGNTFDTGDDIQGTTDDPVYQTERWNDGNFTYSIPVPEAGEYEVTLEFAEIFDDLLNNSPEGRVFDVQIEEQTVLDNFNILDAAGGAFDTPVDKSFLADSGDGAVDITFVKDTVDGVENPKISGIVIRDVTDGGGGDPDPTGDPAAALDVNAGAGIDASTFNGGSMQLTNSGDVAIGDASIDLSTALLNNANNNTVFDPTGEAGDAGSKGFTVDSSGGTGVIDPSSETAPFANPNNKGYDVLNIAFDGTVNGGFEPGETLGFSVDIDPTSIQGATTTGDAGSVSGLEMTGAEVTVDFEDGNTRTGHLFGDGSKGGSTLLLNDADTTAPSLSVNGQSGEVTSGEATPAVQVTGGANETVTVMVAETGLGNGVARQSPFDANEATDVSYIDVALDGSGVGSFDLDLPADAPVYMTAAVDNGDGTGAVSETTAVDFDENAVGGTGPDDDFDGDGTINAEDSFWRDATDGKGTDLVNGQTLELDFESGGGVYEAGGFTGNAIGSNVDFPRVSGTATVQGGQLTATSTATDPVNDTNNAQDMFMYGVDTAPVMDPSGAPENRQFTAETRVENPWDSAPPSFSSLGLFLGVDQDNYLKGVFNFEKGGQLAIEQGGTFNGTSGSFADAIAWSDIAEVGLKLSVDAQDMANPTYGLTLEAFDANGQLLDTLDISAPGQAIDPASTLGQAILGTSDDNGLGVGVINTNFNNSQTFEAAWNDLKISAPQGTIVDETPPTVDAVAAPDITAATGADQNVTLTLSDDTALDVSEIDPGDISVTGPGGSDLSVTSAAVNEDSDGTPRSVTYGVAAPGGDWDAADNGTYTVSVNGGEIADVAGNTAAQAANAGDFEVNVPEPGPAKATVAVTEGDGVGVSTFGSDSFTITNESDGGQQIETVTLNIDASLLPHAVFDPEGGAGDATGQPFKIGDAGNTGITTPDGATGSPPFAVSKGNGGFVELTLGFDDFDPGETMSFGVDLDPTSIEGVPTTGGSGKISGLELIGSDVSVGFSNGADLDSELFGDTSQGGQPSEGGGKATVTSGLAAAPTMTLDGLATAPGDVGQGDTRPATEVVDTGNDGSEDVTLDLEGMANGTARVLVAALDTEPDGDGESTDVSDKVGAFGGNTVTGVQSVDVDLDSGGQGETTVTLNDGTPGDGLDGRYAVTAAQVDPGTGEMTSLVSTPTFLKLVDEPENQPPVLDAPLSDQETTAAEPFAFTVPGGTFSDPDPGDTLTLTASLANGDDLPDWLSFDPATGSFSGTPGESDTGSLDVEVTASDGTASVSDTFTLTVATPAPSDSVTVHAGGTSYEGDPVFSLWVNGQEIAGDVSVPSGPGPFDPSAPDAFEDFTFDIPAGTTVDSAQVVFENDAYGGSPSQDRNLWIDGITINGGETLEAENAAVANFQADPALGLPPDNGLEGAREDLRVEGTLTFETGQPDQTLTLYMGGQEAFGVAPAFEVFADGDLIGSGKADTPGFDASGPNGYQPFDFAFDGPVPDQVSVHFNNDAFDPATGEDRNLWVDKLTVDGETFEAEEVGRVVTDQGFSGLEGAREDIRTNGEMTLDLTPPTQTLSVFMGGQDAFGDAPKYQVLVDGQVLGQGRADTPGFDPSGPSGYEAFDFALSDGDPDQVQIRFTNDAFDGDTGDDRNLWVDRIELGGDTYQAEDAAVADFQADPDLTFDGVEMLEGAREDLRVNGTLTFDLIGDDGMGA